MYSKLIIVNYILYYFINRDNFIKVNVERAVYKIFTVIFRNFTNIIN